MHTAIRESRYPRFAILPEEVQQGQCDALMEWLTAAGIQAPVFNPKPAGTYSGYSAIKFGAIGCTAELGKIGLLGQNDLTKFAAAQAALRSLLTAAPLQTGRAPEVFVFAQELHKYSENFHLCFDAATENFTAFAPGTLVAQDGDIEFRVGSEPEYVVFPNAKVAVGKRAGLLVVKVA